MRTGHVPVYFRIQAFESLCKVWQVLAPDIGIITANKVRTSPLELFLQHQVAGKRDCDTSCRAKIHTCYDVPANSMVLSPGNAYRIRNIVGHHHITYSYRSTT